MANVLRLYQITDTTKSGKDRAVPNLYFNDKGHAKAKRKELNETETGIYESPAVTKPLYRRLV